MKNNYIPEILKEKIYLSLQYTYAIFLLLFSILSLIALLTFNINDNSFLTNSSFETQNFLGEIGSYYASFIFYTFGVLGYLIILFFFIYSLLTLLNKSPRYIFIRLLCFFISLILLPQSLIYLNINFIFIESIETWGEFAVNIHKLHNLEYLNYFFSLIGFIIFLISQNLISLFKLPRLKHQ